MCVYIYIIFFGGGGGVVGQYSLQIMAELPLIEPSIANFMYFVNFSMLYVIFHHFQLREVINTHGNL